MTKSARIYVDREIQKRFPDLKVSALRARFLTEELAPAAAVLEKEMRDAVLEFGAAEPLSAHQAIVPWRKAMARMGQKPSRFPSSLESLARRAIRDAWPVTGIPIVDLYNRASLALRAPMGAYDERKLDGRSLTIRFAKPESDFFEPLGGEASSFPIRNDVAVYADDREIFCWGINVRDSRTASVDLSSTDVIFFVESLDHNLIKPRETLTYFAEALHTVADSFEFIDIC